MEIHISNHSHSRLQSFCFVELFYLCCTSDLMLAWHDVFGDILCHIQKSYRSWWWQFKRHIATVEQKPLAKIVDKHQLHSAVSLSWCPSLIWFDLLMLLHHGWHRHLTALHLSVVWYSVAFSPCLQTEVSNGLVSIWPPGQTAHLPAWDRHCVYYNLPDTLGHAAPFFFVKDVCLCLNLCTVYIARLLKCRFCRYGIAILNCFWGFFGLYIVNVDNKRRWNINYFHIISPLPLTLLSKLCLLF